MVESGDQNILISQASEADKLLEQLKYQVDGFISASIQSHKARLLVENAKLLEEINALKKVCDQNKGVEPCTVDTQPSVAQVPIKKSEKKSADKKEAKKEVKTSNVETSEIVDVGRLDFRIGHIISVEKHPDADSLYVEQINVGEAKPRTVVSGLVKHMSASELNDQTVVVLCNLKPAKMRGVTSEAMVMCASTPEKVELLVPPTGSAPGDVIEFEGYTRNPDAVLNPKKKIFETCAPDLRTDNDCIATYKSVPFIVPGKGKVVAKTLPNVQIK